jgi:hypothetical protein
MSAAALKRKVVIRASQIHANRKSVTYLVLSGACRWRIGAEWSLFEGCERYEAESDYDRRRDEEVTKR